MNTAVENLTFRERIAGLLTSQNAIVGLLVVSSLCTYFLGGPGYLLGLLYVIFILWSSKGDWKSFGLDWSKFSISMVCKAFAYAICIVLVTDIFISPSLTHLYNESSEIEQFNSIQGNTFQYIIFIIVGWINGGFGEELFYRGFMMKRIGNFLNDENWGWIIGLVITSVVFGLVHQYQGMSGVISTGIVGFMIGVIYFRNRTNLLLCILIHGLIDTIGITLLYTGNADLLSSFGRSIMNF